MTRWAVVFATLLVSGCFEVPALKGPFRCDDSVSCGGLGWVCDDGVCCSLDGAPACRTRVMRNGQCASGAAPQDYFLDLDGDGYGSASSARRLCAQPWHEPWVSRSGDCNDDPGREGHRDFPGAVELCDGVDNDCNGLTDDSVIGVKEACTIEEKLGVCSAGVSVCDEGAWRCVTPLRSGMEVCDGIDNNCNGQTDEAPQCGGPVNLMSVNVGLSWGAKSFSYALHGGGSISGCLKNHPNANTGYFGHPTWSGSGASSHLFFTETRAPWDLSLPGTILNLTFSYSMLNAGSNPWSRHGQPVVYLCDDAGGHARFVHFENGQSQPLMKTAQGDVATQIPLSGSDEWVLGANVNLDLTRVIRLELLIQPAANASGSPPSFNVTFPLDGGLGFEQEAKPL